MKAGNVFTDEIPRKNYWKMCSQMFWAIELKLFNVLILWDVEKTFKKFWVSTSLCKTKMEHIYQCLLVIRNWLFIRCYTLVKCIQFILITLYCIGKSKYADGVLYFIWNSNWVYDVMFFSYWKIRLCSQCYSLGSKIVINVIFLVVI